MCIYIYINVNICECVRVYIFIDIGIYTYRSMVGILYQPVTPPTEVFSFGISRGAICLSSKVLHGLGFRVVALNQGPQCRPNNTFFLMTILNPYTLTAKP